ncbi:hypothetical protein K1719_000716 [Acacia pycnantha]|nr:hypothetical protein K1719_000716 [Acacia pycnantha]
MELGGFRIGEFRCYDKVQIKTHCFTQQGAILNFTCMEMKDLQQPHQASCSPRDRFVSEDDDEDNENPTGKAKTRWKDTIVEEDL